MMSEDLADGAYVILGAGGHARVVLSTIRIMGSRVLGCTNPTSPDVRWPPEVPWLGDDQALEQMDRAGTTLVNGIGSVNGTNLRRIVYERAIALGFHFPPVIHTKAYVDPDALLREGCQVMAGAIVQTGVRIHENALVNTGARVDHDVEIGAHSHVAPGTTISGDVRIGKNVHIGAGATIVQGLTIADGAVIAAGAVVIRNVAEGTLVAGVPAKQMLGAERIS